MSSNIAKLDNIFKVLHQDHSYFLTYPTISRSQINRRMKDRIELTRYFQHSKDKENAAASKIAKSFSSFRNRKIYQKLKCTIYSLMSQNPALFLRRIDPTYFSIFEKDKYTVVFRLAGEIFPPHIAYKIFGLLYVISSYNFPVSKAHHNVTGNKIEDSKNTLVNNHLKKHDAWRICYIYKHDKTNRRSNMRSLISYRKNTNLITWIAEKYGY